MLYRHPYRYGVVRLALPLLEKKAVHGALVDVGEGGNPRPCLAIRNFGLAHGSYHGAQIETRPPISCCNLSTICHPQLAMLIDSIPANLHACEVDALLVSRVALRVDPLVSSASVYEEAVEIEIDAAPITVRG